MENNAIGKSYRIEIQDRGTLAIIGNSYYGRQVVFMASGLSLYGSRLSLASNDGFGKFAKNPIFTHSVDGSDDIIIFEHNLGGELRNPQKLLRSVRNKLIRAINVARSAFEDQMKQLYHKMSMAEHPPNRYTKHTDDAERRGYESPTDFLKLDEQSTDLDSLVG
ncbi:MAG: hypothetical protein AAB453_00945 [Patescibacteria group bacterium]